MTGSKSGTTDPVESLLDHLDKHKLQQRVPEFFFGPDSILLAAIESPEADRLIPKLKEITAELDAWDETGQFRPRWELQQQLAKIRTASTDDVSAALEAFDALAPNQGGAWEPFPNEDATLRPIADKYDLRSVTWKPSHWQLLDCLADWSSIDLSPIRERTPILLANEDEGRVYYLVVERLPGPPGMIYPHWWKLGLMHLGKDNSFLKAVHKGLHAIINQHPGRRLRLRWWLERHPATKTWFDSLDESRSVEVAAACVAKALYEQAAPDFRPLLDDTVAVSATLEASIPTTETPELVDYQTGAVGHAKSKKDAALEAKLSGIVFSSAQKEKDAILGEPADHIVVVQPAATLNEAYDALLVTSKAMAQYKQAVADEWDKLWIEEETPAEDTDATKKQK